jgi:hypothetical protein
VGLLELKCYQSDVLRVRVGLLELKSYQSGVVRVIKVTKLTPMITKYV